ncbi:MAG: trpG [Polyangiaceae bacterium]|jgi:para-aminobenzoate synthetase component 2|nr:trpG [Polyangiaceae bacterium]
MSRFGMARVLVVDNYDSFTYNLVQCLTALGAECLVRTNDETSVADVLSLRPAGLLISPGPGAPEAAGVTLELIRELSGTLPILGVCLGHQALALAFGGRVERAPFPIHGKTSDVTHDGRGVFRNLPSPLRATRYHSLVVTRQGLPTALEVSAETASGEIMGLRHRELPIEGVQFHPESILTDGGPQLVQNWLSSL